MWKIEPIISRVLSGLKYTCIKYGREYLRYSRTNELPWPPKGVGVGGGYVLLGYMYADKHQP